MNTLFPCNKRISAQKFYKVLNIGFDPTRSVVVRITEGSFSLLLYYSFFVYIDLIFVNTSIFGYSAHMILCMWKKNKWRRCHKTCVKSFLTNYNNLISEL